MNECIDFLENNGFKYIDNCYQKDAVMVFFDLPIDDGYLIESGKNKSGNFKTLIGLKRFLNKYCK